jgi:hypothetical protein
MDRQTLRDWVIRCPNRRGGPIPCDPWSGALAGCDPIMRLHEEFVKTIVFGISERRRTQ